MLVIAGNSCEQLLTLFHGTSDYADSYWNNWISQSNGKCDHTLNIAFKSQFMHSKGMERMSAHTHNRIVGLNFGTLLLEFYHRMSWLTL